MRNWLAEATLLEVFAKNVHVSCRINLDATQYRLGSDGILHKVIYNQEDKANGPITREEDDADGLCEGIKVINQISAGGFAAPLVILMANRDMKPAKKLEEKRKAKEALPPSVAGTKKKRKVKTSEEKIAESLATIAVEKKKIKKKEAEAVAAELAVSSTSPAQEEKEEEEKVYMRQTT